MASREDDDTFVRDTVFCGTLAIIAILACSCATYDAIQALPIDWWIGLESVLIAMWEDVVDVIRFLA